jgi:amino acid transporter
MPPFGVISQEARGHVVTTILIAMVAMLFTAISYGRMARAYPAAGSAFTYVGREINPAATVVPGASNASASIDQEMAAIASFLASFDEDIPYSLLVFHSDYLLADLPVTPRDQVEACVAAVRNHLNRVHVANLNLLK